MSLNYQASQASGNLLRAIAHPLRMYILAFIDKNKSTNVKNIYKTLDLEQSIVSQHLRILRQAGLVLTQREGKFIFYVVDYSRVEEAAKCADVFSQFVNITDDSELDDLI